MGIVGVACKAQIAKYSELIAIGLTTGLMGSITTYASFNQDMAELFVAGRWEKALFGIILGEPFSPLSSLFRPTSFGQRLHVNSAVLALFRAARQTAISIR